MEEKTLDKKYTDFIEGLIVQIEPLLPKDVNKLQEDYLISNIKKSASTFAVSMEDNDEFSKLNFENQCFYIQVMAEWSFHKEIDLFRSGIPAKYWKIVMQKIWYTMWEVMYACVKNDAPETAVLSLVERFVNRSYNDAVEELKEQDIIDEKTEEKAKEQSNIAIMAYAIQKEQNRRSNIRNILFYLSLFICISIIVSVIIMKFQTAGVIGILTLLVLYHIVPLRKGK